MGCRSWKAIRLHRPGHPSTWPCPSPPRPTRRRPPASVGGTERLTRWSADQGHVGACLRDGRQTRMAFFKCILLTSAAERTNQTAGSDRSRKPHKRLARGPTSAPTARATIVPQLPPATQTAPRLPPRLPPRPQTSHSRAATAAAVAPRASAWPSSASLRGDLLAALRWRGGS